jgi:hypothetical protein
MSSSQHRSGAFGLAHLIAQRIARAGENPYADDREQYVVLDDGEVIEFGRPLRDHRMFAVTSRAKVEKLAEDFAAFAAENPLRDWRFWTVCRPTRKTRIADLENDYREFNAQLNRVFTDLRQRLGFEYLLCGLHVRFDFASGLFDLHAHVVCRAPAENLEEIRSRLLTEFSRVDLPDDSIRSAAAVARYLAKAYNPREVLRWPEEALLAAWRLGGMRFHYTRAAGAFARWRAARKAPTDPHHLALIRARRQNRAQTRYTGTGWELQDRLLVTRDWNFAGGLVRGSLFRRARGRPTCRAAAGSYSTATTVTTQTAPSPPPPMAVQPNTAPGTSPVKRARRWVNFVLEALRGTCAKIGQAVSRVFHRRE